jgi:hypothetical protein
MKNFSDFTNYYGFSNRYSVLKYLESTCPKGKCYYILWEERNGPYPPYKIMQKLTIYHKGNSTATGLPFVYCKHYNMWSYRDEKRNENPIVVCNYYTSEDGVMLTRQYDYSMGGNFTLWKKAILHILDHHSTDTDFPYLLVSAIKPLNRPFDWKLSELCAIHLQRKLLSTSSDSRCELPCNPMLLNIPYKLAKWVCNYDSLCAEKKMFRLGRIEKIKM